MINCDLQSKGRGEIGMRGNINFILKCVALAMGVAVAALSFMDKIETSSAVGMLGIGLACLAVTLLSKK